MMLERAERAGARIEKARVLEINRTGTGWRLRTNAGAAGCGLLRDRHRRAQSAARFRHATDAPRDSMSALGYYVPGDQAQIDIQFLPQLEGYIWVFPRCGHLSVGICGKGEPAASLRKRLENYMAQQRHLAGRARRSTAICCRRSETPAWKKNRVAGDGWMAVGDAAGLVDPVTGEGIYYALRSADLAAKALLSELGGLAEKLQAYRAHVAARFRRRPGIRLAPGQARLPGAIPVRLGARAHGAIHAAQQPRFSGVMQDLFAGTQPYLGLKNRLMRNLNGSLLRDRHEPGPRAAVHARQIARVSC